MRISRATPKAIRYACMKFHYAKAVPAVKYGYNIFNDDDEWCGVVLFGSGANNHIAEPFGMCQGEVLELVRVALNGKQNTTSQAVAMALRELKKQAPYVKIVVSYADADQKHYGTIYQATNWIYLGHVNKGDVGAFIVNGKKMHPKSCHSKGWKQNLEWLQKNVDAKARRFITDGKRKYIFCFYKKDRKKWLKKAVEYPKKEGGEDGRKEKGEKEKEGNTVSRR